jgi:hypothetical protein
MDWLRAEFPLRKPEEEEKEEDRYV